MKHEQALIVSQVDCDQRVGAHFFDHNVAAAVLGEVFH
jgi:hypothetical protein